MADLQQTMELAETNARQYFREGLNCAECVLKSFWELGYTDFPPEIIALASGFGGGIGKTKNACGAVLGACLAIGTMKGRKNPHQKETVPDRIKELNSPEGVYQFFTRFIEEFEEKYGNINCSELSKGYEWEGKARKKNCQELVGYSAYLAVKYALENEEV